MFFQKSQSGDRAVSPQIRQRKLSANDNIGENATVAKLKALFAKQPAMALA
jgi:hypothetical protein